MNKFFLSLFTILVAGQALAQTPTPIQTRKTVTPVPESVTVYPTPNIVQTQNNKIPNIGIPDYCANSRTVFRGILTYDSTGYSINFKNKLCFTDGKEVYKIDRIFLIPWHPQNEGYLASTANQPVRVTINSFAIKKIRDTYVLVTNNFYVVDDF